MKTENRNIVYTVDYVANVQEGILSLMIKSNLKEGDIIYLEFEGDEDCFTELMLKIYVHTLLE